MYPNREKDRCTQSERVIGGRSRVIPLRQAVFGILMMGAKKIKVAELTSRPADVGLLNRGRSQRLPKGNTAFGSWQSVGRQGPLFTSLRSAIADAKGQPGLFILDKGKPVERPGRKATGLYGCTSVWRPGCRRNVVALFVSDESRIH